MLNTPRKDIETYVMQRTMTGIQALKDVYQSSGEESKKEKVNSTNKQIAQLRGKTNLLIRNVEETRAEIKDVEKNLSSKITQTAEEITTNVSKTYTTISDAQNAYEEIRNDAKGYAETAENNSNKSTDEKLKKYTTTVEMDSKISQSAESIATEVSKTYTTKEEASTAYDAIRNDAQEYANTAETNANNNTDEKLKDYVTTTVFTSKINQTAETIEAEVKRAQGQEVELAAAIKINADNITSKVTKGDVSSEISQEAGKITIKSNRLSIESTNFTLSENGTVTAKNVDLSGKITATSGKIGGFTIGEKSIYSGSQAIGVSGIYIGSDGISSGTNFKVDSSGKITARDCDISGGEIGGFKIGESSIYSQYAVLGKAGVYIGTNGISCGSDFEVSGSTGVLKVRKISYLNTDRIDFYSGVTISSAAVLCGSGKTLGFFGLTGNVKKSVSKITIPSSATASSVATTLNNLLDALKSYNLIG